MTHLDRLAEKSGQNLYEIKSVFPFDLFPDSIVVDINKVTITKRYLFSQMVFPILIKNINGARVFRSILFSTIRIEISGYETNPGAVKYLKNDEAIIMKNYILGLIAASREGIDLTRYNHNELKTKLLEVGETQVF